MWEVQGGWELGWHACVVVDRFWVTKSVVLGDVMVEQGEGGGGIYLNMSCESTSMRSFSRLLVQGIVESFVW